MEAQDSILAKNLFAALEFFKAESIGCPNREVVGFLGIKDGKPVAKLVSNRSPNPQEYFMVDPIEQLIFGRENNFILVFHSHIYGDSSFSEFDTACSDNLLLPFLVYSIPDGKFNLYVPPNHKSDEQTLNLLKTLW